LYQLKPKNHKFFFEEVAKEIGVHKDVVDDIVTFYYNKIRKNLSDLTDTHINVASLGTFIKVMINTYLLKIN
jgi:nucleoid DNA-binding protein